MKTVAWSDSGRTVIIPYSPSIFKRHCTSILLHDIKEGLFQSGKYETSERVMESTLLLICTSKWTDLICVECKHAPPWIVRSSWQRISSRRCGKSLVISKQARLSNSYNSYILSLMVCNALADGIVERACGKEHIIQATLWSYCSVMVRLAPCAMTSLAGAGGAAEREVPSRLDLSPLQNSYLWPS